MKTNNTPQSNLYFETSNKIVYWIVLVSLILGLILSIVSALELCVEHCSANKEWLLFNLPFGAVGISFFIATIGCHLFSSRYPILTTFVCWMIASAFGAEIMFIIIQKTQIGHWCPVCLSIAFTICVAGSALLYSFIQDYNATSQLNNRGLMFQKLKQVFSSVGFLIAGFALAFIGATKIDPVTAATNDIKHKIVFGNQSSQVDVYLFTDWFCPACLQIEPIIEKMFPKVKSEVAFYFVDFPVHTKSENFTPYNLAFMINNKADYFKARKVLHELTEKTESPTDEDIQKIATQSKLHLKEPPFIDIKNAIDFYEELAKKYSINATPIMVILNTKTNHVERLEGDNEITEVKVLAAIEKAKESSKK